MKYFLSFIISCFLLTCSWQSSYTVENISDDFRPEDYFVQLEVLFFIKADLNGSEPNNTYIYESKASGTCVERTENGCYILTVNHFCDLEPIYQTFESFGIPSSLIGNEYKITLGNGSESRSAEIIDTDPSSDLCLLYIEGSFPGQLSEIYLTEDVDRFIRLQNYSAPIGLFDPDINNWTLFLYEGNWSGFCSEGCETFSTFNKDNFILHSIPTTQGQSGSAILYNNAIFGIQSATRTDVDNFGLAVSPEAILNFLRRNQISLFVITNNN